MAQQHGDQRRTGRQGPVRILLCGASGRMGRAVASAAGQETGVCIVARYARNEDQAAGVQALASIGAAPDFDVALDFSRPDALASLLELCVERRRALVSGTTGLDLQQLAGLDSAAAHVPVLTAANFSLGVAVLEELVERAARALGDWDCDIVEAHHTGKQDAPSGTALLLGAAVDRARAAGHSRARPVRYASLRCGDVVGEHTVQLAAQGERLELVHRATDRAIFARGALEAARRLAGRTPGRYRLAELLLG